MGQLEKSIVLVGMTGAGKTTIGKILAREMKINFFDIDQEIEKVTTLRIKDFFKMYGEQEFRRIEKSTLFKFIKRNEKNVISPGAGIFNDNEIREKLNNDCICVFLNINLNSLTLRLKKNLSNRPKLSKGKLEDNLKEMYIRRIKDYKKSHITIDVNEISIPEVVSRINKALINYEKFNKL